MQRSYNSDLKSACENALQEIEKHSGAAAAAAAADNPAAAAENGVLPELQKREFRPEIMFTPFELACQSRSARLVTSSLDSVQKLVAYGHIRTNHSTSVDNREFDDHLVSTVANCFSGPQTDEAVQLQVLKALLTIVTSPYIRVHEESLLLSVRTCYNVYLASKNLINQTTAKATLNQMLNYIFTTMEANYDNQVQKSSRGLSIVNGEAAKPHLTSWDIIYPLVEEIVDNIHDPTYLEAEKIHNLYRKDAFLVSISAYE